MATYSCIRYPTTQIVSKLAIVPRIIVDDDYYNRIYNEVRASRIESSIAASTDPNIKKAGKSFTYARLIGVGGPS